jgi:hypothetical protein
MTARRSIWILALAAALTALLAGACSKAIAPDNEEDDGWTNVGGDIEGATPIRFSSSLSTPTTKSYDPLNSVYTSFRVFAFYQPAGTWADLNTKNWTPNFMYNQEVNWDTDHWTYSPLKYWPNNPENTITFWAYAPANASVTLYQARTSTAYSNTSPGLPDVMFTVPATADYDFLVSEFDMVKDHDQNPDYPTYFTQDLSKPSLGGGVNFLFRHVLCKVNIKVAKNDPQDKYDINLNTLSLESILFTGVLNENGKWGAGSDTRNDFEVLKDSDADVVLSTSFVSLGSGILLPQRLTKTTTTPKLTVQYKYKSKSAGEYTTVNTEVPLGDILSSWDSSLEYTFNIKISPGNPILFTADVVKWASDTNGYFNVN